MNVSKTEYQVRPSLVVVLSRFPYPLEKGDKLRAFNQLKILSESHDITLICTSEESIESSVYQIVEKYCKSIHVFSLKRVGLFFTLIYFLASDKPFQLQYFYRKSIHRKINSLINEVRPDHIFCQLVRVAEYIKDYHFCPKTIDFMDALSKGMERRISTEKWYKQWFYRIESKRLAKYERSMFDYFEHFSIISEQDRNFILHPKQKNITVVPNGVDQSFFMPLNIEKDFDIVFTGNFSYPPNIEAAIYLAEKVLPELNKIGNYPRLLLSGANPTKRICDLTNEHVHVSGWVDDIRISYQRTKLFVAPLFIGTGLQNKLLEAMASGLPCITTPLVNNALGGTENENIVLAENLTDFVEKIVFFLSEGEKSTLLAENGKKFIQLEFTWAKQTAKLNYLLQ